MNTIQINVKPVLMGVEFLHAVSEYLRGDVPLSYLRDWVVSMQLSPMARNTVESAFLARFEGVYAEYCDLTTDAFGKEIPEWKRKQLLNHGIHKAICCWDDYQGTTGTETQFVSAGDPAKESQ